MGGVNEFSSFFFLKRWGRRGRWLLVSFTVNRCSQPIVIIALAEIPTVLPYQANETQGPETVGPYVTGRKIIDDAPLTRFSVTAFRRAAFLDRRYKIANQKTSELTTATI